MAIPSDGILLVSFGPHTVAGKDGKAVVRERLAIIEAEESSGAAAIQRASRAAIPLPAAVVPRAALAPLAKVPMPVPAMPSRSIPQGLHSDGTPADLPPLPADEMEDSPSESSEPMASPQSKKTRPSKPVTDTGASKAGFTLPRPMSLPSLFLPAPSIGLQFLVPIKPFSLQLPFNQKLEIELFGRVVSNPKANDRSDR